jgi:hypothetical protein
VVANSPDIPKLVGGMLSPSSLSDVSATFSLNKAGIALDGPLLKCFFFAALIFCVTGVSRLSVGETKAGFLFGHLSSCYFERERANTLSFGHALREKGPCAHSWGALVRWTVGSVTERCLWYGDVGSILWIM